MTVVPTIQESGMVQATAIRDRLGSLHIWIGSFGEPVNTTGELYEMNERESDIFFQFDNDQSEFFMNAVPSSEQDSDIDFHLDNGNSIHVWVPDYYIDVATDMATYYDRDIAFI